MLIFKKHVKQCLAHKKICCRRLFWGAFETFRSRLKYPENFPMSLFQIKAYAHCTYDVEFNFNEPNFPL